MAKEKIKLDGKTWIKYSVSIWDIAKTKEERRLKHPAMFPLELCNRLIKIYTSVGDTVMDPFVGSGSAIVSAKLLARRGIGIDINNDFIELCKRRLRNVAWGGNLERDSHKQTNLSDINNIEQKEPTVSNKIELPEERIELINDSCLKMNETIKPGTVDFILTSPPYWDILNQERTADYKEIRRYSEREDDISNITDYNEFLKTLSVCFKKCYDALKNEGYFCIVVMDIRKKDKFYPFHSDIAKEMEKLGFKFEDIIVWNRLKEYNNLRSLGYPYVFRVNKVHEYVLIFKK
jgi:DNA modification methylase